MALLIAVIMVASVVNSQIPAYYFHKTSPEENYFYSNTIVSMDEYVGAAEWFEVTTAASSRYTVDFDVKTIPFYYAERSIKYMLSPLEFDNKLKEDSYIFINPSYTYHEVQGSRTILDRTYPAFYDNGEIKIYQNGR